MWKNMLLYYSKKVSSHSTKRFYLNMQPIHVWREQVHKHVSKRIQVNLWNLTGHDQGQPWFINLNYWFPPLNESLNHDFLSAACTWSFTQTSIFPRSSDLSARSSWVFESRDVPPVVPVPCPTWSMRLLKSTLTKDLGRWCERQKEKCPKWI